jgi:hypothetical protein
LQRFRCKYGGNDEIRRTSVSPIYLVLLEEEGEKKAEK